MLPRDSLTDVHFLLVSSFDVDKDTVKSFLITVMYR